MTTPADRHYLEELSDELSLALGQAIWTFAKIEALTYDYIKKLSKEVLNDLLGYQSITSRINLIKKLISRIDGFTEEKNQALSSIGKVDSLSKNRNTIAHNPWLIWIDFEKRDFITEIQDFSKPMQKLDLDKVKEFTIQTQELVMELSSRLEPLAKAVRGF